MVQNLEGMGFTVVPFGQGFKDMSPPTKELMPFPLDRRHLTLEKEKIYERFINRRKEGP